MARSFSCNYSLYPSFGWEAVIVVFCSCMLLGFITTLVASREKLFSVTFDFVFNFVISCVPLRM